ncbi:MAG TPA: cytochrome c [Steroidobacteraceae bacterium]|nr:cytochrome c [Steroidobacteraceae bacterium]
MTRIHRWTASAAAALAITVSAPVVVVAADHAHDAATIARGKYIITVSGCNDCHTPGGMEKGPAVPEREWLTGLAIGYQGPWGTTYPTNLRLVLNGMTEAQWLKHARQPRLPPMPWFNLKEMSDADLKAVYAFVRSLGPAGQPMPAYVAPGGKVTTPYFVFVPRQDAQQPVAQR